MIAVKLRLEFAPRAHANSTASAAFLVVGLALLAAGGDQVVRNLYANAEQQQDIAALEVKRSPPPATTKSLRKTDPQDVTRANLVRQTSRQLTTPWANLLAVIETTPQTVALLTVEPSAGKRSLILTAESANAIDMLDYVGLLQGDARLYGVTLVSHQVQEQAPGRPLRFQVRANWGVSP